MIPMAMSSFHEKLNSSKHENLDDFQLKEANFREEENPIVDTAHLSKSEFGTNSPTLKNRCFSIDLGVLRNFGSRLNSTNHDESMVGSEIRVNRRRLRTFTGDLDIDPSFLSSENVHSINPESRKHRSKRVSTVNQFNQLAHILKVKQPLPNIDRYSMIEGQIS